MPRPLRLVRDTDPLDSALAFPGPESPLSFDDHVREALAVAFRPRKADRLGARLALLSQERMYMAVASVLAVMVMAVALAW